jgi:outer membrane protein OmpA-like peptidoglycan-associated protein
MVADRDADGIPDVDDACALVPEDMDGFEDDDGCPDLDNDDDGVVDARDQCPHEAEVVNGVDDTDGCPDKTLAQVQSGRIDTEYDIGFKGRSAILLPASKQVLADVARVLSARRDIARLRIEGHTDSTGPAGENLELSERRAAAVLQLLLRHGVAPERLLAVGLGEARPVQSNRTAEGRARNHRVELTVVGALLAGRDPGHR